MELASAIGNGRKITEFTMAKSAELAAMQTANVSSTVSANPLSRHKERTAYFRSRKSVSMTCAPPSLHFAENGRGKLYRRGGLAPANQYVLWKSYARAKGKVPSGYAAFEEVQHAVLDALDSPGKFINSGRFANHFIVRPRPRFPSSFPEQSRDARVEAL